MHDFQKYIRNHLNNIKSAIPMDVVIQGVSISDATIIDISKSARRIASSDHIFEDIDFGAFYDVAPPINSNNLFIQFHSSDMRKETLEPGWIGVHCVDFQLAKYSILFSRYQSIPGKLISFPKVYSFVIYRELPEGLSTSLAGTILGIKPEGKVSEPGFFPIMAVKPSDEYLWKQAIGLNAWVIYLVLSSFGLVNQGEANLCFTGEMYEI